MTRVFLCLPGYRPPSPGPSTAPCRPDRAPPPEETAPGPPRDAYTAAPHSAHTHSGCSETHTLLTPVDNTINELSTFKSITCYFDNDIIQ